MTPGQVAYEAFTDAQGALPWADLTYTDRAGWETAAQAVLDARNTRWTAAIDQFRRDRQEVVQCAGS